ncbi:hypothetical protein Tco_0058603 [Tanacetum coccineum]
MLFYGASSSKLRSSVAQCELLSVVGSEARACDSSKDRRQVSDSMDSICLQRRIRLVACPLRYIRRSLVYYVFDNDS